MLLFSVSEPPTGANLYARQLRISMAALIPFTAAIGLVLLARNQVIPAIVLFAAIAFLTPLAASIIVGIGIYSIGIALWPVVIMLVGFAWGGKAVRLRHLSSASSRSRLRNWAGRSQGHRFRPWILFFGTVFFLMVILVCWLTVSYSRIFFNAFEALGRTQRELALSQRQLLAIIETEPECVKVLDTDGTLQQMNRAGLDMIEADSLDQVAGKSILGVVAPGSVCRLERAGQPRQARNTRVRGYWLEGWPSLARNPCRTNARRGRMRNGTAQCHP